MIRLWIILLVATLAIVNGCPRAPTAPHGRRTRGDSGYKLILGDNPKGYEPGKTYNLLLLGSRTHNKLQQFTHFTINAEASSGNNGKRGTTAGPKRVGRFQLYSDGLTKFGSKCINTVAEADDLPKTEIQVMWVAPATGSGCVVLSAMVYESPRSWFADDGELSKVLCEKKSDAESIKKECCACNEAKYNFIFEGIWSNETHPKDFPFAIWLTHFSDVVGASHDSNFSFWGENHIATDGFRSLAEFGSPSLLETELRTKGSRLRTLIKAPGLWYPSVNTNTSSTFRVDRKHHKVSLASMFGPSPDWVVGVSGLDLCTEDCSWKESYDMDLYPWDAGTDNGISYMSPNAETQPREKMYRITNMYPEDPRAPFYNPSSNVMTPLAKLYIRREKIISRNCDDDFLQALQLDVSDQSEDQDTREECAVTQYKPWSPCSVTCGKGIRSKVREYINPEKASRVNCKRQLVSKEMCVAPVPECLNSQDEEDEGENLARAVSLTNEAGEGIGVCRTTSWSNWSECSASCGIGITMRTRSFINHLGRKRCPHIVVVEKEKCMKPECTFEEGEIPDAECPVNQWSDWSPCTVTCGKGVSIRTRLLLVEPEKKEKCEKRMELYQQKECSIVQECPRMSELAKEICKESLDHGPCRYSYNRYWYNHETRKCEQFTYGGCRGNKNNFFSEEECYKICQHLTEDTTQTPVRAEPSYQPSRYHTEQLPQDCVMSDWSEWSTCSARCGEGFSERRRYVMRQPSNGGQECQKKTIKRRRCIVANCN